MPLTLSPPPIALTIAGFDPLSGAGISADLKTFAAHGLYGVACITALTVQSTLGVFVVEPVRPEFLRKTLNCLAEDIQFSGVKIGMLATAGLVEELGSFLPGAVVSTRIVLDPVLRSSSGAELLDAAGVRAVGNELLSRVGWVTPNLDELAVLLGEAPIHREAVPEAAGRLQKLAAAGGNPELNVVVTGGHLDSPDDFLLTASGEQSWLPGQRVETESTHGTGCAFSSALLCALITGLDGLPAVAQAKAYVAEALRLAYPIGRGKGPLHHLFPLRR